jgi:DNA-binding NarL/FixJ family response regulator
MSNAPVRVRVLLAGGNGAAGAAMRDVVKSLANIDFAWDVHDASEALRLVEQMHPDVALFSHSLMSAGLLTTIRSSANESASTKILVISMHNDSRFALRMIEAGASGYMLEDRAVEELANAVKTIMSGRTYLSPGIAGMARDDDTPHGGAMHDRL